jgi:hypothetical protein
MSSTNGSPSRTSTVMKKSHATGRSRNSQLSHNSRASIYNQGGNLTRREEMLYFEESRFCCAEIAPDLLRLKNSGDSELLKQRIKNMRWDISAAYVHIYTFIHICILLHLYIYTCICR